MNKKIFSVYIVFLWLICVMGFSLFKNYFTGAEVYKEEITVLKNKLERQRLKTSIWQYQLEEHKQFIAMNVFNSKNNETLKKTYKGRHLASLLNVKLGKEKLLESGVFLFERGKRHFRSEKYEEANQVFLEIINLFPDSSYVIESYFLLIEGLYRLNDYTGVINYSSSMIKLFPEHDLTGFALLRMGAIYQEFERMADAAEIYRAVLRTYSSIELTNQAKKLLNQVEL